jgi:hypothetical protein
MCSLVASCKLPRLVLIWKHPSHASDPRFLRFNLMLHVIWGYQGAAPGISNRCDYGGSF